MNGKAWDNLSMTEKAEMMRVAVKNGITDLATIREKYNGFAMGGDKEELPPIVPFYRRMEVIITPDSAYNQYLNTLPDNQRFTPNDKYDSYLYWKLNGKPKDFSEAYDKGMFHFDNSDKSYHANSIAWGDDGVGYFMKPKTHDTVGYELDWFNKGLVTEEGGWQRPETFLEWKESQPFRESYKLIDDPNRPNYYRYQPVETTPVESKSKKKALGGPIVERASRYYDGLSENSQQMNSLPWQGDWITDDAAQRIENIRHPRGHYLNTLMVTAPYISDSQRMKANLQENIDRAQQKNARDSYTLQRNMNQTQDEFAKNFGLNLYGLMGGIPLHNLGWEVFAHTSPDVGEAIAGDTGRKIGNYISMTAPLIPLAASGTINGINRTLNSSNPNAQYIRYGVGKVNGWVHGYNPKLPTMYRKIKSSPVVKDGKVQITPLENRFAFDMGYGSESPVITNMSSDVPVWSNTGGNWSRGLTLAFPGKRLLGKNVVSTSPTDTFLYGDNLTVPMDDVTVITGRPRELQRAEKLGLKTLSSPQAQAAWQKDATRHIGNIQTIRSNNSNVVRGRNPIIPEDFGTYSDAIEEITRNNFRNPTLKDYQFMDYVFKPMYKSQVIPVVDDITDDLLFSHPDTFGDWVGDSSKREYITEPSRWRNVMYDPATPAENNFRDNLGIYLKPQYRQQ